MYQTRHFIKFSCIVLTLAFVSACDQHTSAGSNTVTISPAVTNQPVEKDIQPGLDKSPMDMCYYPIDYPKLKMSGNFSEPLIARLIYSRPQKNSRTIFGDLIKYGSTWRLGANDAAHIATDRPLQIGSVTIQPGTYTLFLLPNSANNWQLVVNRVTGISGLDHDPAQDIGRVPLTVTTTSAPAEAFAIDVTPAGQLVIAWDRITASVPIQVR